MILPRLLGSQAAQSTERVPLLAGFDESPYHASRQLQQVKQPLAAGIPGGMPGSLTAAAPTPETAPMVTPPAPAAPETVINIGGMV